LLQRANRIMVRLLSAIALPAVRAM